MSAFSEQLNKLNERAQELSKTPSELAKDALLADVRAFYDEVKALKVEAKKVEPKKAPAPAPKPVEVAKPEPVVEVAPEPVKETVEEAKAEVAEKAPEPVAEATVEKEEPKPVKEPMIAEAKAEEGESDEKILAGQFNNTPLKDLRSGIPLNEKFGIIRNLFKGNASDFGDAVLKLNNAANGEEISHYMDLLSQRFGWDTEAEAYKNFSGYVERKKLTL
ncbi:MAG: hypothetical protein ACPGU4_04025 [Flavobacteriales bacterium]